MMSRKSGAAVQGTMLYMMFLVIGFGRIRISIDRLPVDPGYEFFEDTYKYGISALFKTEGGYLDIPRRVIAEYVTLFPIRQTGIVGSLGGARRLTFDHQRGGYWSTPDGSGI